MAGDDKFLIVQGKGAGKQLMKTAAITKSTITISKQKFLPAVQQVSMVGYNGASGSLPAANSTDYYLRIRRNDNNGRDNSQPTSQFAGPIKTDAAATQSEVAKELVKSGIKNFDLDPDGYIKFEMLNAGARTAVTATGTVTILFTKGSKKVTASAATATTNFVAGDYIALDAATTTPVYKITSKDGSGNLTLEWPYQGETTAALTSTGTNRRIANAAAVAAASGVQMTGVENAFNVNTFRNYYTNRFTATFSDTAATITSSVGARNGAGVWQQVAMDEYMTYGFEGQGTIGTPPTTRDAEVVENAKYSIVEISWKEDVSFLTSNGTAVGSVLFYAGLNAAGTLLSSGGTATAAGKVADLLGAIAVPTFASTDLNA
jgi:hypothetical protein